MSRMLTRTHVSTRCNVGLVDTHLVPFFFANLISSFFYCFFYIWKICWISVEHSRGIDRSYFFPVKTPDDRIWQFVSISRYIGVSPLAAPSLWLWSWRLQPAYDLLEIT